MYGQNEATLCQPLGSNRQHQLLTARNQAKILCQRRWAIEGTVGTKGRAGGGMPGRGVGVVRGLPADGGLGHIDHRPIVV